MAKKKPSPAPPPLRLEWRSPAELAENPANWRRHPDAQTAALADVIAEVGWAGACLYNERTKRLIDGHARRKVALEQGCERVPVLVGDWSEADERKILATLDPLSALAERDEAALAALLAGVSTDSEALQALLDSLGEAPAVDAPGGGGDEFDATPEEQGPTRTNVGEVWVIGGRHRLLVGDCTVRENVERLMGGKTPDAVVTDPPYGVGVDYGDFKDTEKNVVDLIARLMPILLEMRPVVMTPGIPAMWSYPRPTWLMAWLHPAPSGGCPWGFGGLNPILAYGDDPYLKAGLGRRPDSIVCVADRQGVEGHPTPKPLKVWSWLVERVTPKRDSLVFDPFLGSGTTMVAAHRLGRQCFGMELECRYADVILKRAEAEGLSCELAEPVALATPLKT